ncbi:sigma-54 interaction domain-containing protein [Fictibacillus phosphorivorans]|uniref:sigma-54 interaction domain-containing protein n=1 Tax=Fictibacillus phosphorivorans TaxID=1221500 RepID=UPI00203B88E6|nr:sigma 54-interacting transcriptional regulator [Fictibacillus phosphorivorans]MCM3719612.1 sigma 54-interacting transcriptional regulator [Fictibacillus phosphorivorans]MCM3777314.1 sigma 54-interacting transcriptional regulator [Fictibacillus phosphorivorans]
MISGSLETAETLNAILKTIDEGIHVVNANGITIFYNSVAASLDGLTMEEVHNQHVLEAFPSLTKETSTLLKVIQTGTPIYNKHQSYMNRKGKQIDTVNSTLPLWLNGELIGAVEVAKDISKVKQLSDKLLELQAKMKKSKSKNDNQSYSTYYFDDILSVDPILNQIKEQCQKASRTSSPIMIYGETGTGKEMFVQAIHHASPRANKPFVVQNCAAIPGPLLEGILFGTTKGSFTGAIDRPGVFELADEGTLFLDEINSMPIELQAKLLRVIQEGVVQRVGSTNVRKVDVRIISALNESPEQCLSNGVLRQDLFFRLNVVYIELPPLRERLKDISFLSHRFIKDLNTAFKKNVTGLTEEAEHLLYEYKWPGNIRELKHAIEHCMNFADNDSPIGISLLPKHIKDTMTLEKTIPKHSTIPPLREALGKYEKQLIKMALKQTDGNIQQAARILQVPRQTLQYKMKQK